MSHLSVFNQIVQRFETLSGPTDFLRMLTAE
jgi:hypothetical protein